MDSWLTRFHEALVASGVPRDGRGVLAGVSGGPDSVALACLLAECRAAVPDRVPALAFAHVHHGLRGAEAEADAEFVQEFARRRGARFLLARVDAQDAARRLGLTLEAAARMLRYEAFERWAAREGFDTLCVAHHRDDQAETVLLRAIRGAGLRGLVAMASSRPLRKCTGDAPRLVRPLLAWRREEILDYLESRGQSYRTDSSNADERLARNRVRRVVLPSLEEAQGGASASLAQLAADASVLYRDLRQLARALLEKALVPQEGGTPGLCLRLAPLRDAPESVLRETIVLAWEESVARLARGRTEHSAFAMSTSPVLSRASLEQLSAWITDADGRTRQLALRDRVVADLRYGHLWFSAAPEPSEADSPCAVTLGIFKGGEVTRATWQDWRFELRCAPWTPACESSAGHFLAECVDADRVARAGPLCLRSRQLGDRVWPLGAPGTTRLKEFLRQRRVRPRERDSVPLLVAGDEIVWVVGHRMAHPFRVGPETERVLHLTAARE